jgi:two-component system, NarL family, sensor kinase
VNEDQIFILFILGTLLLTIFTISLGAFLVVHKRRQHKNKLEKQQLETELIKTRLEEQEKSLKLLSEEIHDNVVQVLGLSKMYLHNVSRFLQEEEGSKFLGEARDLLSKAITELRDISHSINSDLLYETGLAASMERELNYLQDTTTLRCTLDIEGKPFLLEKEKNLLIFRMVQESIQNAVKHSGATSLSLFMKYSEELLEIIVEDNGSGFDLASARERNTLGLRNIHNRTQILRGNLHINSEINKGTKVHLKVPLRHKKLLMKTYES